MSLAPYVFAMVNHASKLDLKWDIEHKKYNTPKGKVEESFHLGKHCTWIDSKGPLLGAYPVKGLGAPSASSSQAPPPTQSFGQLPKEGPSHFRGAPKKMKGNWILLHRVSLLASTLVVKMQKSVKNI
jgi:hypothetical protein